MSDEDTLFEYKGYTPQKGTIPFRVLDHLRGLPPGTEVPNVELAEAIGNPESAASLFVCLRPAVNAGLVKKGEGMRGNFRITTWSLGNGKPLPIPKDEPLVKTRRTTLVPPSPPPQSLPTPALLEPTSADDLDLMVGVNGNAEIRSGEIVLRLSLLQTVRFRNFLNSIPLGR